MGTVQEYRRQADEARRLARGATSTTMRKAIEEMARTWDQLADEREGQLKDKAPRGPQG